MSSTAEPDLPTTNETTAVPRPEAAGVDAVLVVSFLTALLALVGSLYLTLGMGLQACPLCLYQRTFVMSAVAVLGVGLLARFSRRVASL